MSEMTEVEFAKQLAALDQKRLYALLDEAIGMFLEYRDRHEYEEEPARAMAIMEIIDGMQAIIEIDEFDKYDRGEQ